VDELKCPRCGKKLGIVLSGKNRCFYCGVKFLVKERFSKGRLKRYICRWPRVVCVKGYLKWDWRVKRYISVPAYKRSKDWRD